MIIKVNINNEKLCVISFPNLLLVTSFSNGFTKTAINNTFDNKIKCEIRTGDL